MRKRILKEWHKDERIINKRILDLLQVKLPKVENRDVLRETWIFPKRYGYVKIERVFKMPELQNLLLHDQVLNVAYSYYSKIKEFRKLWYKIEEDTILLRPVFEKISEKNFDDVYYFEAYLYRNFGISFDLDIIEINLQTDKEEVFIGPDFLEWRARYARRAVSS